MPLRKQKLKTSFSHQETLPSNNSRRNFLKVVALGGAALALTTASKKIDGLVKVASGKEKSSAKKVKISEGLSFIEDSKEFTFFDKAGNELLIFEKGA